MATLASLQPPPPPWRLLLVKKRWPSATPRARPPFSRLLETLLGTQADSRLMPVGSVTSIRELVSDTPPATDPLENGPPMPFGPTIVVWSIPSEKLFCR